MIDDDLPPPWISDLDLCRLIERVTKRPATVADARAWRKAIERERARRARRRAGLSPVLRSAETESATALILDMLRSPEGRVAIAILWAVGSLIADRLDADARRLHERLLASRAIDHDLRAHIDGLARYASEKAAPGGRASHPRPDPAHTLPAAALAALNAATSTALAEWVARLTSARRAPATRPHLLRRLVAEGTAVIRAHPDLDLGRPLPGSPLGIWPPAPPEPDSTAPGDDPAAVLAPSGRR